MLSNNIEPTYDPNLKSQTEAVDITDEELRDTYTLPPFKWYHRAFQIFTFLITLGPIRLVLAGTLFFMVIIIVQTVRFILRQITTNLETGKYFCIFFAEVFFRAVCFSCGIVWTKYKGSFDPEARFFDFKSCRIDRPICFYEVA